MSDPGERPVPGRLRVTAYAVEQVLWLVPLAITLVLLVVGGVLVVVWVGVGLVAAATPLLRIIANRQRRIVCAVLQVPVPDQYRPAPSGGPLRQLRAVLADPMTWRDLVWLLWAITFGWVISLLLLLTLLLVVTGFIWWYAALPLMQIRAAVDRTLLTYGSTEQLERRVAVLTRSRADAVDHNAAELRRLERDLHDGTQARLVALSMSLGLAESVFDTDPATARRIVDEARASTTVAIQELRSVVRGIHPPVLADRGLVGALSALALDLATPVAVSSSLAGRPPVAVESAIYFAAAECLTNSAKHAGHRHAWIELGHDEGVLHVLVGDDGRGGADPDAGSGMRGVMRRLAAFDGTMVISSPAGGPTLIRLEVPCALSSPKTAPSSAPA